MAKIEIGAIEKNKKHNNSQKQCALEHFYLFAFRLDLFRVFMPPVACYLCLFETTVLLCLL